MKQVNKQLIRKGVLGTGVMALALASGFAQAAFVSDWGYSTDAVFSAPTWDADTGGLTTTSATELSWGNASGNFQSPGSNAADNRSALTVGNFAVSPETKTGGGPATSAQLGRPVTVSTDAIFTGSEIGRGTSFTHWNNPILASFKTLTGATITDTINLYPTVNPNGTYSSPPEISGPTLTFDFKFRETPNGGGDGGNGLCANGATATNANPCGDLFGYTGVDVLNISFGYEDFTYYIQFLTLNADGSVDTIGIGHLASGECWSLGLGGTQGSSATGSCFGFKTAEAASTTERFGFAITSEPISIPEPGTLALLGLGLLGIGHSLRRKIAA